MCNNELFNYITISVYTLHVANTTLKTSLYTFVTHCCGPSSYCHCAEEQGENTKYKIQNAIESP